MTPIQDFNRDDPRFTAFVLGELNDADHMEVEEFLQQNEEAREFVSQLETTSHSLRAQYEEESLAAAAPSMGDQAHEQIHRVAASAPRGGYLAIAASVIALVTAGYYLGTHHDELGTEETELSVATGVNELEDGPFEEETVWVGTELKKVETLDKNVALITQTGVLTDSIGGVKAEIVLLGNPNPSPGTPSSASTTGPTTPGPFAGVPHNQTIGIGGGASGRYGGRASGRGGSGKKVGTSYGGMARVTRDRGASVPQPSRTLQQVEKSVDRKISPTLEDSAAEAYQALPENPFILTNRDSLSTFSIDVDTASYANARRFLRNGELPPADSIRIEEFINYFTYDDAAPTDGKPFSVNAEMASCPWEPRHRLLRVGLKAKPVIADNRPPANLVFLIDVSGSMRSDDKLALLVRSMKLLVENLNRNDRVAMVVYAGASGLVLPSTSCDRQAEILSALDQLRSGGSTNGGEGIQLAYNVARENFIEGGINRVILATDGDFNVGIKDRSALQKLIEEKRETDVFLSVLGFGKGNLKDSTMELLADKGNGNYSYIDSILEAQKVLVDEMGGTLVPVAKDVKIQVEFNPRKVQAYRLVGYENRLLAHEDFADDTKDAGEIGAGHSVIALYEVIPSNVSFAGGPAADLRYQDERGPTQAGFSDESLFLKLRYKQPDEDESALLTTPITDKHLFWHETSDDFRFSAAVAAFAMTLRGSQHLAHFDMTNIYQMAVDSRGDDQGGYRTELLSMMEEANRIMQTTER